MLFTMLVHWVGQKKTAFIMAAGTVGHLHIKLLKSVGKNALKGIHKKCTIKVPKTKLTAYKRLLKKKGQKANVKIIK